MFVLDVISNYMTNLAHFVDCKDELKDNCFEYNIQYFFIYFHKTKKLTTRPCQYGAMGASQQALPPE